MALSDRLRTKGFEEHEIARINSHFENAKNNSSGFNKTLSFFIFPLSIILIIITHIILGIVFIPIFLAFSTTASYSIIFIVAFAFGMFEAIILKSMEHLGRKQLQIAGIISLIISFIVMYYVAILSNQIATKIFHNHNPLLLATIYSITFIVPYLIFSIEDYHKLIGLFRK